MSFFSRIWRTNRGGQGDDDDDEEENPSVVPSKGGASSCSLSSDSVTSENQKEMDENDNNIDDPEAVHKSALAIAWFQKRSRLTAVGRSVEALSSSSSLGGGALNIGRQEGLVDIDEDIEIDTEGNIPSQQCIMMAVDVSDDVSSHSGSSPSSGMGENEEARRGNSWSPSRRSYFPRPTLSLFAGDSNLLVNPQQHHSSASAECDRFSTISAATSDLTPVVCNKSPFDSAHYQHYHQRERREAGLTAAGLDHSNMSALGNIRESATERRTWKEFCDYTTHQGKVALLLMAIFALAMITIIVSSTHLTSRSNSNSVYTPPPITEDNNNNNNSVGVGTPVPEIPDYSYTKNNNSNSYQNSTNKENPRFPTPLRTMSPTVLTEISTVSPTLPTTPPTLPTIPPTLPTIPPTLHVETDVVPFEDIVWLMVGGTQLQGDDGSSYLGDAAFFGSAVAVSSSFLTSSSSVVDASQVLVVGSRDATMDTHAQAGQIQVFTRNRISGSGSNGEDDNPISSVWVEQAKLTGRSAQDAMGTAVAVSQDGRIIVAGEPGTGAGTGSVRAFRYNDVDGVYIPLAQELLGPSPVSYFGATIALSGRRLAVGAPSAPSDASSNFRMAGQVKVFELASNESEWHLMSTMSGTDDFDSLGSAVDLSEDGRVLVASAPLNSNLKGYVRVWRFNNETNEWIFYGDIANNVSPAKSDDRFGNSLSVSGVVGQENFYRVAIGSPSKGSSGLKQHIGMVLVYELVFSSENGGTMKAALLGDVFAGDYANGELGYSVKLRQGQDLLVGSPGSNGRQGRVYLRRFDEATQKWEDSNQKLEGMTKGDDFGFSVAAVSSSESVDTWTLVVGAVSGSSSGSGYVTCYEPI